MKVLISHICWGKADILKINYNKENCVYFSDGTSFFFFQIDAELRLPSFIPSFPGFPVAQTVKDLPAMQET